VLLRTHGRLLGAEPKDRWEIQEQAAEDITRPLLLGHPEVTLELRQGLGKVA
jgi:hypothetical protein